MDSAVPANKARTQECHGESGHAPRQPTIQSELGRKKKLKHLK